MTNPELLKVDQAADLLGLARSTTYSLVSSGVIPSVRLGRSLRIPRRQLMDWIDKAVTDGESSSGGLRGSVFTRSDR